MAGCRRRWSCAATASARVVLERGDFGVGASTRNGGMISGGTNLGKGLGGKSPIAEEFERKKAELMGAGADSLTVLEDIIAREKIECGLHKNGRFVGAWTPRHYDDLATKVEIYNKYANAGAQHGAARAPARVHRLGLLLRRHACHARRPSPSRALLQGPARGGTPRRRRSCARRSRPSASEKHGDGLARADGQGTDRVPRGGGRDQRLYRRSDAAAEAPRRAGGEPHHRHRGPARAGRQDADPRDARRSATPSGC